MIPVYAFRPDGWPLCPMCHEDELYSLFAWDGSDPKPPMQAWIDHGLRCYRCSWSSTGEKPLDWPMPARVTSAQLAAPDHYPWCDETRACLCADVVVVSAVTPPIAQPFVPAAAPPAPPAPQRFVKFGDSMVCLTCNLDARYCRGHTPSPPPPPDGDGIDSDLNRRIREARGRDGR